MNRSTPDLPAQHQLPESTKTHVHWVGDAIQPSHPLSSPSPPVLNLSQHQGLFKWVSFLHQVAKVLEFQLQHQPFQWTPRTGVLQDQGFPNGSDSKESARNTGDPCSIPGSQKTPGEGNGNTLQYCCLENYMDREAWRGTVHGVAKSQTQLSD